MTTAATNKNSPLPLKNTLLTGEAPHEKSMLKPAWKTNKVPYVHTVLNQSKMDSKNTTNPPSEFLEFEAGRVHEILSDLGYQLQDCGQFYRTKALYRGGDSLQSLKVWKNSGYCIDYAADKKFPLKELLNHHIPDWRKVKEILGGQRTAAPKTIKKKLYMPRTYPLDCLDRLLPNYAFYKKRGISDAVQKKYKLGFATVGQMYQRMVFPIFNETAEIVGFSGRHIDWKEDGNAPKWKHIGKKETWIYPYYLSSLPECREKIDNGAKIMLVESIGDSLALTEHGLGNHLVTFGLGCSNDMQAFLLSKDPEEIVIVGNNDEGPNFDYNRGKVASIKTLMKLSSIFPLDRLKVRLPSLNDLSEMHESGVDVVKWSWNYPCLTKEEIRDFINENTQHFASDKVAKFLKKL